MTTIPPPGFDSAPYPAKRAMDLALLAVFVVPALVVGVVAAVAVRVTSRGPATFRQERVGQWGEPFVVWKLRTMVDDDNPVLPDADRITAVGRWLRRTSLDELPQLAQVATGQMSFVGPRPTLAYQVDRYDHRQRQRLCVRPGLTGLAQIRGRNAVPWAVRIEHDLEYVAAQSPALDLRIVTRTFGAVLGGHGHDGHPVDDPLVGPAADGPVADGLVADGPAGDGLVADGPAGDGLVADGPVRDGLVVDRPTGIGPTVDDPGPREADR